MKTTLFYPTTTTVAMLLIILRSFWISNFSDFLIVELPNDCDPKVYIHWWIGVKITDWLPGPQSKLCLVKNNCRVIKTFITKITFNPDEPLVNYFSRNRWQYFWWQYFWNLLTQLFSPSKNNFVILLYIERLLLFLLY